MKTRNATTEWIGQLGDGGGQITSGSTTLDEEPYGFRTRFGDAPGTNPEELLAAAHSSCFAMHLAMLMGAEGVTPGQIVAEVDVEMRKLGPTRVEIASSHISVNCRVRGMTEEMFTRLAEEAGRDCPMSRALGIPVTVTARLTD